MPALVLNTNDDGSVTVAPCDPSPEMLAEGETFASMDEALKAAGEVLGEEGAGEEAAPGEGGETATEEVAEPPGAAAPEDEEEGMDAGYLSARRGH